MTNINIIFFVNQKGGSGKSTMAFNTAIALSSNNKVALIEPIRNVLYILSLRKETKIILKLI